MSESSLPDTPGAERASVAILLSTYNGATYLAEQLESIREQTNGDWLLLVRDDGSSDSTPDLIEHFVRKDKRIMHVRGRRENLGPLRSFSYLLAHARELGARRVMFCDQDDIWEPKKLTLSLQRLIETEALHPGKPILLHTDLAVMSASGATLDASFWRFSGIDPKQNATNRLLLENTVTGCTALLNRPLIDLVGTIPAGALMHDWWIALVASMYGHIEVLPIATVRYRQHGSNVFGARSMTRMPYATFLREPVWRRETYLRRRRILFDGPRLQAEQLVKRFEGPGEPAALSSARALACTASTGWLHRRWLLLKHGIFRQRLRNTISVLLLA